MRQKKIKPTQLWGYLFLLPWIFFMLLFLLYPFIRAVSNSFLSFDAIDPNRTEFVGLGNWLSVVRDKLFWVSVRNILFNQALFIAISLVIAMVTALLLNAAKKGAALFRTIYFLPVVTSVTVSMIIFSFLTNSAGPIQTIMVQLGILEKPVLWQFSSTLPMPILAIFNSWKWFGVQMIIFLGGMASIDHAVYEAASIDGANATKQFFTLTLPLLRPQMVFVITMNIINGMQMFTEVFMTFDMNGGPHHAALTPVLYLYRSAFQDMNMGYASTIGLFLAVLIFIMTTVQMKVTDKEVA